MARTISPEAIAAMMAPQTDKCVLILLTIEHDSLDVPLRYVNNRTIIIRNDETFLPRAFQLVPPEDNPDTLGKATLVLDNADRALTPALRGLGTKPVVTANIVLADDPDETLAGPFEFEMTNAQFTSAQITASLAYQDILNEPWPGDTMTPARFPGIYSQ